MTRSELESKTVVELRQMCIHGLEITGMSKKRKNIIIDAILSKTKVAQETPRQQKVTLGKKVDNKITGVEGTFTSTVVHPHGDFGNKNKTIVKVSAGASSGEFPVVGKSVGAVSEFLREVLNVSRMSRGIINGKEVEDKYILKSGDVLEYLKPAGKKGI